MKSRSFISEESSEVFFAPDEGIPTRPVTDLTDKYYDVIYPEGYNELRAALMIQFDEILNIQGIEKLDLQRFKDLYTSVYLSVLNDSSKEWNKGA